MGTNRKKIKIINNVFNKFLKNITFISYPPLGRGNAFSRIINAHDEYFWTFSLSGWEDQYNIYDSLSFTENHEGQKHGKFLFQTIAHQPLFIYWRHNIKNISLKKQFEEFIEEGTDHAKKDFIKCIKSNKLYCIPTHEKIEVIKKNIIIPTKVIYRNPKNSSDFPFDISEYSPEIKPRARKKSGTDSQSDSTTSSTTASTKVVTKENKKETT